MFVLKLSGILYIFLIEKEAFTGILKFINIQISRINFCESNVRPQKPKNTMLNSWKFIFLY